MQKIYIVGIFVGTIISFLLGVITRLLIDYGKEKGRKEVNNYMIKPLTKTEWVPKTLQLKIIKRMFPDEKEFNTFVQEYKGSRLRTFEGLSRFGYLNKPLTPKEQEIFDWYVNDQTTELPVDFAKKVGMSLPGLMYKGKSLSARVLYQNKHKLGY